MLSSCDLATRSKALVVVNDSAYAIDSVTIMQYVSGSRASYPNALSEGETIAAGANMTFYIAPYAKDYISMNMHNDSVDAMTYYKKFTYDYLACQRNKRITAVYDGTSITMSGSNVAVSEK